jgi:hypothetical protein
LAQEHWQKLLGASQEGKKKKPKKKKRAAKGGKCKAEWRLGLDQLAQGSIGDGRVRVGCQAISAHCCLAGAVLQEQAGSLQVTE